MSESFDDFHRGREEAERRRIENERILRSIALFALVTAAMAAGAIYLPLAERLLQAPAH